MYENCHQWKWLTTIRLHINTFTIWKDHDPLPSMHQFGTISRYVKTWQQSAYFRYNTPYMHGDVVIPSLKCSNATLKLIMKLAWNVAYLDAIILNVHSVSFGLAMCTITH